MGSLAFFGGIGRREIEILIGDFIGIFLFGIGILFIGVYRWLDIVEWKTKKGGGEVTSEVVYVVVVVVFGESILLFG